MHVTRRTLLRAGAATAVAGAAAGCGRVKAALPNRMLNTGMRWLGEGAGMEFGASLVRTVPGMVQDAAALLPKDKGDQIHGVYGYATEFVTATDPTGGLHVAVAANYLDAPFMGDEVLSSWAVHNNVTGFITVPAVISLGLGRFAVARRTALLPTMPPAEVHARVRLEMSVNVYDLLDGDGDPGLVTTRALYQVSTFLDRNIQIEWDPNKRRSEQCRLTIREGVVLPGRRPRWDYEHDFAIAPHQIWDDAPIPG
jgi:hypothetical protein